jgi:hypothetical protein
MSRRAFKTDASFLEKISIGAIGTAKVFHDLKSKGHNPIELERGSMSFKIWKKIKIKRVRVPDILCLNCGKRVESRAKTYLKLTMSHSTSDPERGWDFGLANGDLIAFVRCFKTGSKPIDWKADEMVQYVYVDSMRSARARLEKLGFLENPLLNNVDSVSCLAIFTSSIIPPMFKTMVRREAIPSFCLLHLICH